jgi:hypothetical protein
LGRKGAAKHPRVSSTIEESQRTMLLGVIEGNALLRVLSGRDKLSQKKKGVSQR